MIILKEMMCIDRAFWYCKRIKICKILKRYTKSIQMRKMKNLV